jgi:hypothetical protein
VGHGVIAYNTRRSKKTLGLTTLIFYFGDNMNNKKLEQLLMEINKTVKRLDQLAKEIEPLLKD